MPRWKKGKRDPWDRVLSEHITTEMPAGGAAPAEFGRFQIPRGWLIGGAAVLVLLLVGVGVLGALTAINHDRADENLERAEEWRDRSDELSELVASRTKTLNRQTARLNVASNRLRSARRAVQRSEADVETLEVRQQELAAEKADVEDERGALQQQQSSLTDVALQLDACRLVVIDAYNQLNATGLAPDALVDEANATCSQAEAATNEYLAIYGAP